MSLKRRRKTLRSNDKLLYKPFQRDGLSQNCIMRSSQCWKIFQIHIIQNSRFLAIHTMRYRQGDRGNEFWLLSNFNLYYRFLLVADCRIQVKYGTKTFSRWIINCVYTSMNFKSKYKLCIILCHLSSLLQASYIKLMILPIILILYTL